MGTKNRVWPDVVIPPGQTLSETLDIIGMTEAELAWHMGRPAQEIGEIASGAREITQTIARELERALGVPAHVWIRLQEDFCFNEAILDRLDGEPP